MSGRRGPTGPERRGGPAGRPGRPVRPPSRDGSHLRDSGSDRGDAGPGAGSPAPEGIERLRRQALAAARTPATVVARGTLRRVDVEGRPLVLDADDGTTWELLLPPGWVVEAQPGARVTVSGDAVSGDAATGDAVSGDAASTGAPLLRVRSLSRGD